MMTDQLPTLEECKAHNWKNSTVSFYVAKKCTKNKEPDYKVWLVNIENCIQKQLKEILNNKMQKAEGTMEYTFHSVDQDNHLLTIPTQTTNFNKAINNITEAEKVHHITKQEELLDVWFYIARFDIQGQSSLWAVRRAPRGWATRKSKSVQNLIFADDAQLKIDTRAIFKIDDCFDFFSFKSQIFIFCKSAFETDLGFREVIIQQKEELVVELKGLNIFEDTSQLSSLIGDNMRFLRKIAQVKQAGYYKDQEFLTKLKEANSSRSLGLNYNPQGLLIACNNTLNAIFHYLTNGRLESIINQELFDVDAKKKVA